MGKTGMKKSVKYCLELCSCMSDRRRHLPQCFLRFSPSFTGVLTVLAPNIMNICALRNLPVVEPSCNAQNLTPLQKGLGRRHMQRAFMTAALYNACLKHPLDSSAKIIQASVARTTIFGRKKGLSLCGV